MTKEELTARCRDLEKENKRLTEALSRLTAQDVASRERIRQQYTAIFERANDAIMLMQDGVFIDCNPKAEQMFRYSREQIINRRPEEFSPELQANGKTSASEATRIMQKALKGEKTYFEWRHKTSDGQLFDTEISLSYLELDGQPSLLSIIRDVTRQKQEKLREQVLYQITNATLSTDNIELLIARIKEILSAVIDTTNFYIALYDQETNVFTVPYGRDSKDEIASWSAPESMTGLIIHNKKSLLLKKDDISSLIDTGVVNQLGSMCEVWVGVPLIRDNEVIGALVVQDYENPEAYDEQSKEILEFVSHHVSMAIQRHQAYEDLLASKEKAEESNRLKAAFLANISHEIRTPMNAIMGFIELLKEPDLESAEKHEYISIVRKSGQRLLNTINDLIEASRLEASQPENYPEKVNSEEILLQQRDTFESQAREKGIALKLTSHMKGPGANIITDRAKLETILSILLNNALKFTFEGSVQFGNYLDDEGNLVFFVRDTGIGIPEHKQKVIFDRFVQADLELTRPYEGSGLGLSIAKAYTEAISGQIWVESSPGQGSIFYCSIPYVSEKVEGAMVEGAPSDPEHKNDTGDDSLHGHTVLVAEDDDSGYYYLQMMLDRKGVRLIRATTGEEAIALIRGHPEISLVLMDIKMPGMGGLKATRIIKGEKPHLPVIAVTAFALSGDREKAMQACCDGYLSKPFRQKALLEVVRQHLIGGDAKKHSG